SGWCWHFLRPDWSSLHPSTETRLYPQPASWICFCQCLNLSVRHGHRREEARSKEQQLLRVHIRSFVICPQGIKVLKGFLIMYHPQLMPYRRSSNHMQGG